MTRVTLDPEMLARLNDLTGVVEICDENGKLIGVASPISGGSSEFDVPLTDTDVARLRKQPRGRPLREIMADLEAGV